MKRQPVHVALCTLLSVLALACGTPDAAPVVSEETLGTQEAALCSGVSVSRLTLG